MTIDLTVFEGIAKPTPSLPPDSLSIWALTPITLPSRSSSGPPEFPWLIAASVWIGAVDRVAVRRLHRAAERADDAGRDAVLEPERAADRDDDVADRDL